jgi:hypothetical protein
MSIDMAPAQSIGQRRVLKKFTLKKLVFDLSLLYPPPEQRVQGFSYIFLLFTTDVAC